MNFTCNNYNNISVQIFTTYLHIFKLKVSSKFVKNSTSTPFNRSSNWLLNQSCGQLLYRFSVWIICYNKKIEILKYKSMPLNYLRIDCFFNFKWYTTKVLFVYFLCRMVVNVFFWILRLHYYTFIMITIVIF